MLDLTSFLLVNMQLPVARKSRRIERISAFRSPALNWIIWMLFLIFMPVWYFKLAQISIIYIDFHASFMYYISIKIKLEVK